MPTMFGPLFRDDWDGALARYDENGFHLETCVFDAETCKRLVDAGEDLPGIRSGSARPAMNPHRVDAVFLSVMGDPRIVQVVEALCGGPVWGLQSEFFYGRPGVPGFSCHQDNHFVEAPDGSFASAWLALVDVDPSNGGLIVYPGSHRLGILPVEQTGEVPHPNQDPNAYASRTLVPDGYAPVDLVIPRGSIVFLHGLVVHASHPNRSERWRYALLNTYLRQGAPFRAGRYAQRTPVELQPVTRVA